MSRLFADNRFFLSAESGSPVQDSGPRWNWLILVLSMAAFACLAVSLGQDCNWDVLNYHFYSGFAFLRKPLNFDFAPAQLQSFFNPVIHVFSYLLQVHLPAKAAAALLGAVQGLNFYLLFRISQTFFRNWPNPFRFLLSFCNAAAGCYGAIFILELGTTMGDNLSSILILTGLLLIFRRLQSNIDPSAASNFLLGLAGATVGVAFGLKLTCGIYAGAIAIAMIAFDRRVRPLLIFFGFLAIGFVAAYGYWGYSLYNEYENPLYPHMNSLFRSPYYDLANVMDARFFPRTWQQKLFYPFFFVRKNQLACELEFRDVRLAFCYIAVIFLAAASLFRLIRGPGKPPGETFSRQNCRSLLFLALFFVISYAAWQYQFSVYRYLIVLELLAPVFLALVLTRFIKKPSGVLAASLLLNAVICASVVPADFGRQEFDDEFLKVDPPKIEGLQQSVVLMGGEEATSYIIPAFPATTRFVRVACNFLYPGRNAALDRKIHGILAQYDAGHTFVYVAGEHDKERVRREVGFYGVTIDDRSCRRLRSHTPESGFFCATLASD